MIKLECFQISIYMVYWFHTPGPLAKQRALDKSVAYQIPRPISSPFVRSVLCFLSVWLYDSLQGKEWRMQK